MKDLMTIFVEHGIREALCLSKAPTRSVENPNIEEVFADAMEAFSEAASGNLVQPDIEVQARFVHAALVLVGALKRELEPTARHRAAVTTLRGGAK